MTLRPPSPGPRERGNRGDRLPPPGCQFPPDPFERASPAHLLADWQYLCSQVSCALRERGLAATAQWIAEAMGEHPPKETQDCLDACLCLLVALHLADGMEGLMVGTTSSGYIVVPYGAALHAELDARCGRTERAPVEWVRAFRL